MKMWRKSTLAALFLFCTMFFALSMTAVAQSGKWDDNLSWELDDKGTLTITALHGENGDDTQCIDICEKYPGYGPEVTLEQIPLEKVRALVLNGPVDVYWDTAIYPENGGFTQHEGFVPFDVTYHALQGCGYFYDASENTLTFSGNGPLPRHIHAVAFSPKGIYSEPINRIIIPDGVTKVEYLPTTNYLLAGKDAQFESLSVRL